MPKINLAQEAIRNRLIARRRRLVYALSIVILAVVAGVYGLFALLARRVEGEAASVRRGIENLDAELRAHESEGREISMFRRRLKNVEILLGRHVRWSRALAELEQLIVPEAVFSSLAADVGTRQFDALVHIPSVDAAADLVASLQAKIGVNDTLFENVAVMSLRAAREVGVAPAAEVPGGAAPAGGYEMQLRFTAAEDAFRGEEEPRPPEV